MLGAQEIMLIRTCFNGDLNEIWDKYKKDSSLVALFSFLVVLCSVLASSHVRIGLKQSGLTKSSQERLKILKRQNGWFSKEIAVFTNFFFQDYGGVPMFSRLLIRPDTSWNQLQKTRTSGTSKRAKKWKTCIKRIIFKGENSFDALSSRLLERIKVFWNSHMSGYPMEQISNKEDFKWGILSQGWLKKGDTIRTTNDQSGTYKTAK